MKKVFVVSILLLSLFLLAGCDVKVVDTPEPMEPTTETKPFEDAWSIAVRIRRKYYKDIERAAKVIIDPIEGLKEIGIEKDEVLDEDSRAILKSLFSVPKTLYSELEKVNMDDFSSKRNQEEFVGYMNSLKQDLSVYNKTSELYLEYRWWKCYKNDYSEEEIEFFEMLDSLRSECDWDKFVIVLFSRYKTEEFEGKWR